MDTVLKCFRTACTHSASVNGYNRVTHGFYCPNCMHLIDKYNEGESFFPLKDIELPEGGSHIPGTILVRSK